MQWRGCFREFGPNSPQRQGSVESHRFPTTTVSASRTPWRAGQARRNQECLRRAAIVAFSAVGVSCMGATSLLQLGLIDDLPDPKARWFGLPFDSKRVNLSPEASVFGLPDGPFALLGFAVNVPLALAGGPTRAVDEPMLPILAAGSALVQALAAGLFFSKMPRREGAWCTYCVASAAASVAIFALTVPEAKRAIARWLATRRRRSFKAAQTVATLRAHG